jgi:excisionase family DNA binding protein
MLLSDLNHEQHGVTRVNYTEGVIKKTEFFTTSELAEKLKMNVQVITRKVQAGEIRAYKIGKEWRIPEPSVYEWLESNANTGNGRSRRRAVSSSTGTDTPATRAKPRSGKRQDVLEYILAQFEPNRLYREEEVDRIISRHDNDCSAVRSEFVAQKMMEKADGHYRRHNGYRLTH